MTTTGYSKPIKNNDCVIRALATATHGRFDYEDIEFLLQNYRTRGGGTRKKGWRPLMGFLFPRLSEWPVKAKSIRTLERELPSKGTFIVEVTDHLLCISNGVTYDWAAKRCLRVKNVWKTL